MTSGSPVPDIIEALRELGVSAPEPSGLERTYAELGRQCAEYARSLGLRVVTPAGTIGVVPPAFKERFPAAVHLAQMASAAVERARSYG